MENSPTSHAGPLAVLEAERLARHCSMVHLPDPGEEVRAYILILVELRHGYLISLCLCAMIIILRAPIEWCIGEPMLIFFYRILQYH